MQISSDLYERIREVMPIPCVDLLVTNGIGEVLLIRRAHEPAAGQWWFPGGRVYFGELRETAARRKLWEECDLETESATELETFDVILPCPSGQGSSHGITTLYAVGVEGTSPVRVDDQACGFAWKTPAEWEKEALNPFVKEVLRRTTKLRG